MTKDVLLRIQGLQFLQEENENPEPVEMITSGDYYKRNGKHYVLYDEVMEGFDGVTKNIVKMQDVQKGTACAIWYDDQNQVQKVMILE